MDSNMGTRAWFRKGRQIDFLARPPNPAVSHAKSARAGGAQLHQAGSIRVRLARLVVPDPPLVRRGLRIALRRVLPRLLATERGDVEVGPGTAHRLVAAGVDE